MELCKRLFLAVLLSYQVIISNQWKPPSFISNWITISSPETSNIEIAHDLNELPVKVDVQIKVVNNGVDYIFTGTGTMQRDNDEASVYPLGGIVYVYDDHNVVLYPPADSNIGVAYTGSTTDFNGPTSARGLYYTALVRVRAWKANDFPDPLFNLSIPVNDSSFGCFQEQLHGSAIKPDLVVAQVLLPNGMISEGQGNIVLNDTGLAKWLLSGVVFGYDDEKIKLWVPVQGTKEQNYNGAVFSFGDGFGFPYGHGGISIPSGDVVLKGYILDKAFQTTFSHKTSLTGPNTIKFGTAYSLDTALVMVQITRFNTLRFIDMIYVRENLYTANNPGMTFNGVGSSMAGPVKYSGVVYAYNENNALLYTPSSSNPNGYMVYLGDRWGNGQHPSSEKYADVIVTVFSAPEIFCQDPTVDNTSHILTNDLLPGSTVKYTCICALHHTSRNITRYCNGSGNWEGDVPNCTKCHDPGWVYNSTYSLSGFNPGSTATYTCDVGSQYIGGDPIRLCQEDGTWSGIPIVCSPQFCPDPGDVYNASYNVSGQLPGDIATYTCVQPSTIKGGNAERTCQSDGTWSGIPLVCEEQFCPDPANVHNATYTLSGQLPGDTATYTCVPPSTIMAGNDERICQTDGTWSGIPLVCEVFTCVDPGDVYNATYTVIDNNATYTCIPGSSPVAGDSVRVCQPDGSWSGIPVVCVNVQIITALPNPNPVTYDSKILAEVMRQTKKELTVEKKSTNAYKRRLTSATDTRPSAFYLGTGGVAVLCSVVFVVIAPDILTILRNCQNFGTIYKTKPKK